MARETQYDLYPAASIDSRVRHFDGQFLASQDFVDEQRYHVDRLRRHVHHLRVAGVTSGLEVAADGPLRVTIAPGTAVDASGRQLVVVAARGLALPADTPRPGALVLALRYAEFGDRTLGSRNDEPGTRGDTRFREAPAPILHPDGAPLPAGDVALARLAVAADGAVTVTTPPELRRYSGLRLPGPGDSGPRLLTGGDADPARLIVAGALTVRTHLWVEGMIDSFGVHVHVQSFKLGGATDKFYPVVFEDRGWIDGALVLEITRADIHTDGHNAGSLVARFRVHPTNYGHGSDFEEVEVFQVLRFVARYRTLFRAREFVVWLRGGTTYFWRAGHSAAVVYSDPAETTRFEETLPVLSAVDPLFDQDRVAIRPQLISTLVRGNLGVGAVAAAPQDVLHVAAGGSLALRIQAGGGASDVGLLRFFHGDGESNAIGAFQGGRLAINDVVHVQRGALRVGINTPTPQQALDVRGDVQVVRPDGSTGVLISAKHTGYANTGRDRAEISADPADYKALMLVGTRSAAIDDPRYAWPGAGRRVSLWDRLEVNGHIFTQTQLIGADPTVRPLHALHVQGRVYLENGVIQRGGAPVTNCSDLGLYSLMPNNWVRYVTAGGRHVFFNDGGAGSVIDLTIADGAVTTRNRLEVSNGITYTGTLNKLDVADEFTATIRCADFRLGYSNRRGATPGRALVDEGQTLCLNFAGDWPDGTNVGTRLSVGGRLRLDSGGIQTAGPWVTGTTELGLYSLTANAKIRHVTTTGQHVFFNDGGVGTTADLTIAPALTTVRGKLLADTVAWGFNESRTEARDNAGQRGDAGARSGFFQTMSASPASNYPPGSTSWWHLIEARHNNPANNFALQLSGSFYDQRLWFRKTNDNPATPWRRVLTTDDLGVTLDGKVGLGAGMVGTGAAPRAHLDIAQVPRFGPHPTEVKGLFVSGDFQPVSDGVEFRHTNGSQGVGVGYCGLYATGANDNQPLLLMTRGTSGVGIGTGNLWFEPGGRLDVRLDNAIAGWDRLVVTATTLWNGVQSRVTLGAGGADGLLLANPHVGWHAGEKRSSIRYAHINNDATKRWWDAGARDDGTFSFVPSDGAAPLALAPGRVVASGTLEWGESGQRVEFRDNAGLRGDAGARSGFFQTMNASPAGNYPPGSSSWWHLLEARHHNTGNNFAMQFAGSFYDQRLWFRKTNNDPAAPWRRVLTTDDIDASQTNSPRNAAQLDRILVFRHILDPSNLVPANGFLDTDGDNWHAFPRQSINPFRAQGYPQTAVPAGYLRLCRIVGVVEDNWCRPFNGAEEDYCIEFGWTPYSTENTPNTAPAATPAALFTIPGAPSDIGGGGGAGARQCVSMIVPEIAVKPLLTAHPWGYWKGRVHWRTPSTGQRTWIRHLEFQVWDVRPEPSSNPLNFIGVLPTIPVI